MEPLRTYSIIQKNYHVDRLRINLRAGKITGHLGALRFIDKDTRQAVIYIPSLDISGYGEDFQKAETMIKFSVGQFFDHLITLASPHLQSELSQLGWKKGIFNKEFSRSYIDGNGELQNLNADQQTVKRLTLTAA